LPGRYTFDRSSSPELHEQPLTFGFPKSIPLIDPFRWEGFVTMTTMRKLFLSIVAALMVAAISIGLAANGGFQGPDDDGDDHDGNGEHRTYAIGLWGDLPYSPIQVTVGVPNLIADMNRQELAFTVHDGDLKAGSNSPCDDALYTQSLAYLNALKAPAAFTPGDNDWTDCDRPANGGFLALERLDHERQVFFNTPYSQGQHRMREQVQTSAPFCLGVSGLVPCVENRRWTVGGVTYATLDIPGSCNNLCDTNPDPAEYLARNQANIAWMVEAFEDARHRRSAAIMLITQANPGWDMSDPTRAPLRNPQTLAEANPATDGYHEFLVALRDQVTAFRKPVAYVHGDSHYFRIDKPFLDALGRRLENFTRVETFGDNQANGDNDVHWVKVVVDARSRDVFTYQPQIVPGNRTAVPAP
jgi:hypothetical protein